MRRILPWLLGVICVVIVVVALAEISVRQDEPGQMGIQPTALPSPSPTVPLGLATPTLQPPTATPVTMTPIATPTGAAGQAQRTPVPTTPFPTFAPAPTAPGFQPRTPAPTIEPPTQAAPSSGEQTPVTGGGAVPGGLGVLTLALGLALIRARSGTG